MKLISAILVFISLQELYAQTIIQQSCSYNPSDTVIKIHSHVSGETWFIAGTNGSRIFRMDRNKNITEKTSILRQFVNAPFSSVYVADTNKVFVGTKGDHLIYLKDDSIKILGNADGITDSGINYVSGENRYTQRHHIYCSSFDKLFEIRLDTFYNITSIQQLQNTLTTGAEDIVLFQHINSCTLYAFSCYNWITSENLICFEDPGSYYKMDIFGGLPHVNTAYIESIFGNCSPYQFFYGHDNGLEYGDDGGGIPDVMVSDANITDMVMYNDKMYASSLSGVIYSRDSLNPFVFDTLQPFLQYSNIYDMSISNDELLLATSEGIIVLSDTIVCDGFDVNISQDKDTVQVNETPGVYFEATGCFSDLQWYLNSDTFTNIYSLNYTFNQPGTYEIMLTGIRNTCIDSAKAFVFVYDTLASISYNYASENNFNIFPNPSRDLINVNLSGNKSNVEEIIIYDIYGVEVKNILPEEKSIIDNNIAISLNGLNKGIYLIGLNTNTGSFYKRFLVY